MILQKITGSKEGAATRYTGYRSKATWLTLECGHKIWRKNSAIEKNKTMRFKCDHCAKRERR